MGKIVLTVRVGGQAYGVQGIINVTVTSKNNDDEKSVRHICLRAIICREVKIDLIISLPSILYYNLLPLLTKRKKMLRNLYEQYERR